jgi:hypothetical protein
MMRVAENCHDADFLGRRGREVEANGIDWQAGGNNDAAWRSRSMI